jgi:hypothetical protein
MRLSNWRPRDVAADLDIVCAKLRADRRLAVRAREPALLRDHHRGGVRARPEIGRQISDGRTHTEERRRRNDAAPRGLPDLLAASAILTLAGRRQCEIVRHLKAGGRVAPRKTAIARAAHVSIRSGCA